MNVNEGARGAVGYRNAKAQRVKLAALCGVVHYEFAVVIYYLGCPEVRFAPGFDSVEAEYTLLAPINEVVAYPYAKSLTVVVAVCSVAIVLALIEQHLRISDLYNVCDYHFLLLVEIYYNFYFLFFIYTALL